MTTKKENKKMSNTTNYQVTIPEEPKEDKSGKSSGKSSGKKVEPFLARVRNVQRNLKAPKGQFNKFGNYKYRNAEDILEAAKPLLDENDIVLTIEDELEEKADRLFVKATVFLLDIHDSTQMLTAHAYAQHPVSQKGMSDQMLTGSSSSYARKYALGGLFLCDDQKDPDTMKPPNGSPAPPTSSHPENTGTSVGPTPWDQPAPAANPPSPPEAAAAPAPSIPAPNPEQRKWLQALYDFYVQQNNGQAVDKLKLVKLGHLHLNRHPGSMSDVEQLKQWIKLAELI